MHTLRQLLLGVGGLIGIASLVVNAASAVSNYRYRHIEQTINLLQLKKDANALQAGEIIAIEYFSKSISLPLCPASLFAFCAIRPKESFENVDLYAEEKGLRAGAEVVGRNFSGSVIRGGDMREMSVSNSSLAHMSWDDVNLRDTAFTDSKMKCTTLSSLSAPNSKFVDSDLQAMKFSEVVLTNAEFTIAKLRLTHFTNSDLTRAQFNDSDLGETKFDGSNVSGMIFRWENAKPLISPITLARAWAYDNDPPRYDKGDGALAELPVEYRTYSICPAGTPQATCSAQALQHGGSANSQQAASLQAANILSDRRKSFCDNTAWYARFIGQLTGVSGS